MRRGVGVESIHWETCLFFALGDLSAGPAKKP